MIETYLLYISLFLLCVLTVSSLIGEHLLLKNPNNPTYDNLTARVRSWWVMICILMFSLWVGNTAVIVLFGAISFASLREIMTISERNTEDHWAIATSFFVILPIQYISIAQGWYGFATVFIPVYAFLGLPILAVLSGSSDKFLSRISQTQWALMVSVYAISHIPGLLFLSIDDYTTPILLIAFLLFIVQGSDVFQYIWGKLLGRHKIAPRISPNKTWEGFIGGILSSALLGAALYSLTPFTYWQAGLMAAVAALMGFFGGLVMSAIKRDKGIKDWGHLIDGHGGFFDRLDSLAFAAPIFFHLTRFFWQTGI